MLILDVNKISKNYGYGSLFDDVTFHLNEGESISIVGPNGCGKTTILKIIIGIEKPDSGSISINKEVKTVYLEQINFNIEDNRKVKEILREGFLELYKMEQEVLKLEQILKNIEDPLYEKNMKKYCDLIERFAMLNGYEMDTNINKIINKFDFDNKILEQNYNTLSGGEKTLIQLAKTLIIEPQLILLDEPTNHLDIERIEWLEEYIKNYKGALVIVSHDRYFLDKISNKILSIDDYGIGKMYSTNYSGYLIEREKELEKQLAEYEDQQEVIKQLEMKAKEFMTLGMARNSSTLTKQGKVLWERAQRIRRLMLKKPKTQKKIDIEFNEEDKSSKKIIVVEDLNVSTKEGKTILKNINLDIEAGERIALLGANGTGKTTFIKTIMGEQELIVTGEYKIGPSVKIGYIPQTIEFKNSNQTLLEYFSKAVGLNEQVIRSILARFQFGTEEVKKQLKSLSGGEKMRVKLAELLQLEVNTLIFDEPTNHIDIPTKQVLEDAIEDFDGTLIFISHDRFFINKFANKIIEFKNGIIKEYIGNYDDYKTHK